MEVTTKKSFDRLLRKLPPAQQEIMAAAILDPKSKQYVFKKMHPYKKIIGKNDWSLATTRAAYRAIATKSRVNGIVTYEFWWVGSHEDYNAKIGK